MLLTSMLKITPSGSSLDASKVVSNGFASIVSIGVREVISKVDRRIKNLSTGANLAKSEKSNLTRPDLNSKKSNFVKANFCGTDFFISKVKKTFTHL